MSESKRIIKSTGVIMFFTLVGSILGFVVNILLADYFGAGKQVDAFVIANIIPTFMLGVVYTLLVTCFIVVVVKLRKKVNNEVFIKKTSNVVNITLVLVAISTILLCIFSSVIIKLLAPGFDENMLVLTQNIFLILMFSVFFMTLTSFTTGFLYLKKHFFATALQKTIISIFSLGLFIYFFEDWGIYGLAVGVVVGYILSFIVQLLVSLKKGLQHVWAFSINDEVVKNIFALAIPLFISGVFFQIHRSVPSVLASLLQTGDIATLNYAFILITFLSIFIGGSIATVLYPSLTEEIVQLNKKRVDKLISYGVRMNSFVVIPLSFIIILLNKEIISLIYEHGAFTATQTEAVSLALTMYAIGLFAYSLDPLLSKILYALEKMKVRAVLMFVLMILTLVLGVIFMKPLGYAGLALASTLAYTCIVLISFFIIKKIHGGINLTALFTSLGKILFASVCMAGVVLFITKKINSYFMVSKLGIFLYLTTMTLIAIVTYIILLMLIKSREIEDLKLIIKKYF